jgi:Putative transposase
LTVEVLSALFRRLFLEMLVAAYETGRLQFFGDHAELVHRPAFDAFLAPLHKIDWLVYRKKPFAGPAQVLRYLSRYTHRMAISNYLCARGSGRCCGPQLLRTGPLQYGQSKNRQPGETPFANSDRRFLWG